jgi:hypothetical protein
MVESKGIWSFTSIFSKALYWGWWFGIIYLRNQGV